MSTRAAIVSGLIVTIVGGIAVQVGVKEFFPTREEVKVHIDRAQDQDLIERVRELERELDKRIAGQDKDQQRLPERRFSKDRRRSQTERSQSGVDEKRQLEDEDRVARITRLCSPYFQGKVRRALQIARDTPSAVTFRYHLEECRPRGF